MPREIVLASLKRANRRRGPIGYYEALRSGAIFCFSTSRGRRWRKIRAGRSNGAARSRRRSYDVVIVGAGGHGLATAYYLAKNTA